MPVHIRSDNVWEVIAKKLGKFFSRMSVGPWFIEHGSPWENVYIESIKGEPRDELLDREMFYSPKEAKFLIEIWRNHHNKVRKHGSMGYRPPACRVHLAQVAGHPLD